MERLDKFLCDSGVGTRSQVKPIIKSGRVTLDGVPVRDPSVKFDPQKQTLCLDGAPLGGKRRVVVMLNKPEGFVTATEDKTEKTVMELLPEGLLLFTNDGDLLHRLISPGKEVPKVYYARHEGEAGSEDVAAFGSGLTLRDGTVCRSALLEPLGGGESLITVCEGKYHQVRRMMASRGMHVTYLERRREGPLSLGDLPRGAVRELTPEEIQLLDT